MSDGLGPLLEWSPPAPSAPKAEVSFGVDDRGGRERVLELLRDGQWHDGKELRRVGGTRAGARVHELRGQLWNIECTGAEGHYRYRLVGRLTEPPKRRSYKARAIAAEARLRELAACPHCGVVLQEEGKHGT